MILNFFNKKKTEWKYWRKLVFYHSIGAYFGLYSVVIFGGYSILFKSLALFKVISTLDTYFSLGLWNFINGLTGALKLKSLMSRDICSHLCQFQRGMVRYRKQNGAIVTRALKWRCARQVKSGIHPHLFTRSVRKSVAGCGYKNRHETEMCLVVLCPCSDQNAFNSLWWPNGYFVFFVVADWPCCLQTWWRSHCSVRWYGPSTFRSSIRNIH